MTRASILVVEDNKALLEGLHEFLELAGYEVATAEDGLAALDMLGSGGPLPDLIVSDIMMPGMDGYQLLAAVRGRQEWVDIPFVFLTAKAERQDIRSGRQLGADDYLTKPFEVEDLLVVIEARLKRRAELEKLNETRLASMKKRILATINHEFRTPLQYIIAYSDMIITGKKELDPEELRDYLAEIHKGSERLMRLVEDFLLLVEMETGQAVRTYELRKETIHNLSGLVANAVDGFRPAAESAAIELRYTAAPELPPIQGDYTFLTAAVKHLVDNAIKFTKGKGRLVEVGLSDQSDNVAVVVRDDGIGIAPDKHKRLFELFYQVDREKLEKPGVGAGLTIVRHVAELHGGWVDLESEPGKGSCFTLYLPVSR